MITRSEFIKLVDSITLDKIAEFLLANPQMNHYCCNPTSCPIAHLIENELNYKYRSCVNGQTIKLRTKDLQDIYIIEHDNKDISNFVSEFDMELGKGYSSISNKYTSQQILESPKISLTK